ncbi:VOC family protein [Actinophytocola sp. KF-1]
MERGTPADDHRGPGLGLYGVDHLAHVTWKPGETADFYREVLGLPLTHAVTGVGWLSEDFPDFVHFFLGLGGGNYLAFFYFFDDPNGIQLEIVRPLRTFGEVDARDADLTVRALAEVSRVEKPSVSAMWQRKVAMVRPSIWFAALTGGMVGHIERFDHDVLRLADDDGSGGPA